MRRGGGAEGAGSPPGPAHRLLDAALSTESRQQISQLLNQIDALNAAEKLLLYLKLPTGPPPIDPLKQPVNPLGSRAEIHQTVTWIRTHLEVDPEISLPKQDVYEEYLEYCSSTKMKPLSTADFGKVMKQVYPCVKPRRLGTRGNSRYCYAGMKKRIKLEVPQLPDLGEKPKNTEILTPQNDLMGATSELIREWAEKVLGFNFGNLYELAHHLVEKEFVDNSSTSALSMMRSPPELIDTCEVTDRVNTFLESSQNSKDSYHAPKNKKNQRGVIKRLKKKIQSQPQNTNPDNAILLNNNTLHGGEELATNSVIDRSQLTCTTVTTPNFHVKQENEMLTPEYNISQPIPYTVEKCKDYLQTKDSDIPINDAASQALRTFSVGHSRENFNNVAVNLAQGFPQSRYASQAMGNVKSHSLPPRNYGYNQPFKFDNFYNEFNQPTNLSLNSYGNHNSENPTISHISLPHSNVPINLSNSSDTNDNNSKIYNTSNIKRKYESHSIKCENDSLNLSTTNRRNDWPSEHIPIVAPPRKLPLPGKKMILETYNNENQLNSTVKSSLSSPSKTESFNHGEYLPKKMRASEIFSGKLAAAKLLNNPYLGLNEPERFNKTIVNNTANEYVNAAIKSSNSDPIGNMANNTLMNIKPNNETYLSTLPYKNLPVDEEQVYQELSAKSTAEKLLSPKKVQRNSKVKKTPKLKSPDSTNNDIDKGIEKVVTRGRPRKKSLSKAKYTRRQIKSKIVNQCDHTKFPKRSSDSCCSLTETINIKTGIICRENHSEILNRERVSSICNMDKHALDGYLNESNSQEHEEEIMKYFPHNSDSQSNDANIEASNSSNDESELSMMKSVVSASTNVIINNNQRDYDNSLAAAVQSNASDDKQDYLDTNDDHSQGKNFKLTQLRELLAEKLTHNSNVSSSTSFALDNHDNEVPNSNKPISTFNHTINGIESAFTSISRRNTSVSALVDDNNPGSTQIMLPKRQSNIITDRPSAIHSTMLNTSLNARRRVSFEKPLSSKSTDAVAYGDQNLTNKDYQSIPKSPTARLQHFSFMPISPGPHSPVNSSKHVTASKIIDSPKKNVISTSPVSLSSSASPFVSPRITPVPRARNASNVNSGSNKVQGKKFTRLIVNKALYGDNMHHHMVKNTPNEVGNFIIPNEQSAIPHSPNFNSKARNFAMSAPPSPNILTPKYKMNFGMQGQNVISANPQSVIQILPSNQSLYTNSDILSVQTSDSNQSDQSQPLSADPLSHEVSQFFSDSNMSLDDTNNTLRSQSVPLHQNHPIAENGSTYFNQDRSDNPSVPNVNFLSYNNTPCSSIPPTPIPREFCDFGNLNDTCDSISKVGLNSENLDKIYNVLDSNVQQTLVGNVAKQSVMMNLVNDDSIALSNFSQDISNNNTIVEPLHNQHKPFQIMFCDQPFAESDGYWEKSRNVIVPRENKFLTSRSVPSTPLPIVGKLNHPDFNIAKTHVLRQQYQTDYDNQSCGKTSTSKSVPSTPHSADDRNVFSYSNRDFLINGNSVDPNVPNFDDKKTQNAPIDQGFLEESTNLLEVKGSSSVLAGLTNSPLPGAIDIVNNELSTFNDESMDLPFTEQDMPVNVNFHSCIEGGNDFLDLGMI